MVDTVLCSQLHIVKLIRMKCVMQSEFPVMVILPLTTFALGSGDVSLLHVC